MLSFTKTLTALLSILSDTISKNQSMEVFCSKFKSLESIHQRFYPILSECYEFSDKGFKEILKKEIVKKEYCTCGEEDCDCGCDDDFCF
jgi:hypothetical protein